LSDPFISQTLQIERSGDVPVIWYRFRSIGEDVSDRSCAQQT
jgi:hypothetical protein